MAYIVGSITGDANLDTTNWEQGAKKLLTSVGAMALATKVGSALWKGFQDSIVAADDWQKSLSNVNTLLDETATNSQDMALSLLKLDSSLGSTIELTDAMYQAFSAGAEDMDEALAITTQSAKFAKAALTDVSTAVDIITTAMNAYGDETMGAEKASDIFFTTIKQGKINGEQLAAVIGKSIPLFASLGVPLEELGAGMAAMTKQGVNASEATTQLNALMNAFIKPSTAMTEALQAQGFASGSALVEAEGLEGALQFLQETTGGNKEALGELLPSIEAVRGAMALTGTGGEEFNNILKEMENATGATQTAFEKQELTFETYQNQMAKMQLVIGNIGKSFVDDIAGGATEASKAMLQFLMSAEGAELVGNTVGTLAATFHFLKTLLTPLVESILPTFGGILTEIGAGIGDLSDNAGESFEIMDFFSQGIQFSASALRIFGKMIEGAISTVFNLVDAISASGGVVKSFWEFLKGDAEWEDVKDNVTNAGQAFADIATGFVGSYADIFSTVGDEISTFSTRVEASTVELNNTFGSSFSDAKDGVVENWADLLTGQQDFTEGYAQQQQEFLDQIAQQEGDHNAASLSDRQEYYEGLKEALSDYISDEEEITLESYDAKKEALEDLLDNGLIQHEQFNDALEKLNKERNEELSESVMGYVDMAVGALGTLFDYIEDAGDSSRTEELGKIEDHYNNQLTALDNSHKNGILSEEDYNRRKEALDQERVAQENKVKKEQFETNKAWSIANIWLDAAAAGINAWANNDWVTALIITGLVAAEAIAATATVSSQQFVPARKKGGMASGLTQINEAGGEIVTLPDGSQVIPNDISRQIARDSGNPGGSSGDTYNFHISGNNFNSKQDMDYFVKKVKKEIAKDMRTA